MEGKRKINIFKKKIQLTDIRDLNSKSYYGPKKVKGSKTINQKSLNNSSIKVNLEYKRLRRNKDKNIMSKSEIFNPKTLMPTSTLDQYGSNQDFHDNHQTFYSYYTRKTHCPPSIITKIPSNFPIRGQILYGNNILSPKTPKPTINFLHPKERLYSSSTTEARHSATSKSNSMVVNNLIYYERCPYCNHVLNPNIKNGRYNKTCMYTFYLTKQRSNSKSVNDLFNDPLRFSKRQIIKNEKYEPKNFYIDEKGVTIFKPRESTSIVILNSKPNFSRYQKETKTLGHSKNIAIYEAPTVETKVFVRPIKTK